MTASSVAENNIYFPAMLLSVVFFLTPRIKNESEFCSIELKLDSKVHLTKPSIVSLHTGIYY